MIGEDAAKEIDFNHDNDFRAIIAIWRKQLLMDVSDTLNTRGKDNG